MPRRVVIGVGIASYPLHAAGNTLAFLQWVLGFRDAGWEVWIVEDIPAAKVLGPNGEKDWREVEKSANVAHWNSIVSEFGLSDRATLLFDGRGAGREELLAFARDAELFFNISGHFREKEILAAPRERVYVDIDPAFTQIWAETYRIDMGFDLHDTFVSIGRRLGRPDCRAPLAGRKWLPIGVPVALDYFPAMGAPGTTWTTFTHWYGYPQVEFQGEWYGNKSEEFARLVNLPRRTEERLEIATDLLAEDPVTDEFRRSGWNLVDARPLNSPWQRYRDYAAQSRGEFCVAKNGYVRSRCGWFSDRSAMYLALGRPVILQETGWSEFYPAGEGLLSFHDEESAAAALTTVAGDPERHGRAARRIAEKYCSAQIVVEHFLETIDKR